MSQDTISWREIVLKWLHSLPEQQHKSLLWDTIEPLFYKYIPPTLEFLSPAQAEPRADADGVNNSTTSVAAGPLNIEYQELKLSPVHMVNSCCQILQVCMYLCAHVPSQARSNCTEFQVWLLYDPFTHFILFSGTHFFLSVLKHHNLV